MRHLDEGRIHAWLDGALNANDARAADAHVSQCAECSQRVAAARGLIAASSRILTALDGVPAGAIPQPESSRRGKASSRWGQRYGRVAAVIGFVAVGTLIVTRGLNRHEITTRRASGSGLQQVGAASPTAKPLSRAALPPLDTRSQRVAAGASIAAKSPASTWAPGQAPARARAYTPTASATPLTAAREQASGLSAADAAPPAMAPRTNALRLSASVATGTIDSVPAPRLVSRDTVQRNGVAVSRAVYELRPSVRVTLESTVPDVSLVDSSATAEAKKSMQRQVTEANGAVHELRWRDAAGIDYVLFGPVPVDELQRVRKALDH